MPITSQRSVIPMHRRSRQRTMERDWMVFSARHMDMQGIVNGIDYEAYDPKTDAKIQTHYDSTDFRTKKWKNKVKLQEDLGLSVDKKKYMIGLIQG